MEKLRKVKCSFREMTIINSSQGLKNNQETLRFIVYLSYNFFLNLAFSCLALLNSFFQLLHSCSLFWQIFCSLQQQNCATEKIQVCQKPSKRLSSRRLRHSKYCSVKVKFFFFQFQLDIYIQNSYFNITPSVMVPNVLIKIQ